VNGLALSEAYFLAVGAPMIEEKFPLHRDRIAAGLVGDGSECYGFDDEISRDHDWGPGFCLWLTDDDYRAIGESLRREIDNLPREFAGLAARRDSHWGAGRTGVFEIGAFYARFIGFDHVPDTLQEWRAIPEENLAAATNGRVFTDPAGEFSAFRQRLIEFYPEDVRLKKIAARCMAMAQSGQYNYHRCLRRGEYVAARLAEARFISDAISIIFLLNRQYKPFYKWMHRALKPLPVLGQTMHRLLDELAAEDGFEMPEDAQARKIRLIEEACRLVIAELKRQGLSDAAGDFLLDHGPRVQAGIQDDRLRAMDVWLE